MHRRNLGPHYTKLYMQLTRCNAETTLVRIRQGIQQETSHAQTLDILKSSLNVRTVQWQSGSSLQTKVRWLQEGFEGPQEAPTTGDPFGGSRYDEVASLARCNMCGKLNKRDIKKALLQYQCTYCRRLRT